MSSWGVVTLATPSSDGSKSKARPVFSAERACRLDS